MTKELKLALKLKRDDLQEWDKCYFSIDDWKIDSQAPQFDIRIWTGPGYLENQLSHDEILKSLPEDAPEIKGYTQILEDIVKFKTQDLPEMENLVEKEEHPGRAISIANQAAQEAGNRKREAEILAEPIVPCAFLLSRLEARISKLEARFS